MDKATIKALRISAMLTDGATAADIAKEFGISYNNALQYMMRCAFLAAPIEDLTVAQRVTRIMVEQGIGIRNAKRIAGAVCRKCFIERLTSAPLSDISDDEFLKLTNLGIGLLGLIRRLRNDSFVGLI